MSATPIQPGLNGDTKIAVKKPELIVRIFASIVLAGVIVFAAGYITLAVLALLNPPAPTLGQSYYVSGAAGCSDTGAGSQTTPWCSINKAVVAANAGDIVYIAPGTYDITAAPYDTNGTVVTVNNGTASNPIRLIGQANTSIIGQGNSVNDDAHQVFITNGTIQINKDYWKLSGFYVRNRGGIYPGGLYSDPTIGFELSDSLIFVDPAVQNGLTTAPAGGHSLDLYNADNAILNHLEIWSINLNPNWVIGSESPYENSANLISNQYSDNVTLKNSYIYAGANNIANSPTPTDGCLVEGNVIFHGQEHNGGLLCRNNFISRRNVWYPTGQQGPFISLGCRPSDGDSSATVGTVENDTNIFLSKWSQSYCYDNHWYNGASHITYRNNLVYARGGPEGSCFFAGIEYSNTAGVIDSDYNGCSMWDRNNPSVMSGNFLTWYSIWDDINSWIGSHTTSPYTLTEWQHQTERPAQANQDPHSLFQFDPKLATPHAQLGQIENADSSCAAFGTAYANVRSNCQPPFRMKILDDLRPLANSPLHNAGDPASAVPANGGARVDIGAYEYIESGSVNTEPVLSAIGNKTTSTGQTLTFTVTASDVDVLDTLVFSATSLPNGATITDNGNRTASFSWTPTTAQAGTYANIHFSVSDGTATDSEDITITVNNVNQAPVLATIGPKSTTVNHQLSFTVPATDTDTGDTLTFTLTNVPAGAVLTNNGNRTASFSWTPTTAQAGTYANIHFSVSDGTATDSEDITITVNSVNQAPVLAPIGDRTIQAKKLLLFTVTASDPNQADHVSLTAANLPNGAIFTDRGNGTGTFSWRPTAGQKGEYQVTFTASDDQAVDSETITIHVRKSLFGIFD